MKNILYILLILSLFACEQEIHPKLKEAERVIVIDAWLTQKMEPQHIRITRSQGYFDNSQPQKISGATVEVEDLTTGEKYLFAESTNSYVWQPTGQPFGNVGHSYLLRVTVNGETFEATSRLGRVPTIDSITFKYNPKDFVQKEPYFTAEYMAVDPAGRGDAYWVKAWKNGTFLGKPEELNMVFDGGFSASNSADGQVFILPVRRDFINPLDNHPQKKNEFLPPYTIGDSVHVEIHSLDHAAFDFLFAVYFHINRPGGFGELFSMPLANSPTNLKSTKAGSTTNIAGFFNVSAVSGRGKRLTNDLADEAKRIYLNQ